MIEHMQHNTVDVEQEVVGSEHFLYKAPDFLKPSASPVCCPGGLPGTSSHQLPLRPLMGTGNRGVLSLLKSTKSTLWSWWCWAAGGSAHITPQSCLLYSDSWSLLIQQRKLCVLYLKSEVWRGNRTVPCGLYAFLLHCCPHSLSFIWPSPESKMTIQMKK